MAKKITSFHKLNFRNKFFFKKYNLIHILLLFIITVVSVSDVVIHEILFNLFYKKLGVIVAQSLIFQNLINDPLFLERCLHYF